MGRSFLGGIAIALMLSSVSAYASETDQYFSWDREIQDGAEILNTHYNAVAEREIAKLNRRKRPLACLPATARIAKALAVAAFRTEFQPGYLVELDRSPNLKDKREVRAYRAQGIHGGPVLGRGRVVSLTVRVAGIDIGLDKFEHFLSTGYRYFEVYQAALMAGVIPRDAERRTVEFGIGTEMGKLGLAIGGVYSPADLEANFQGFRLYRTFCEGDSPRLVRDDNGYRLARKLDFREHVSPLWDEVYNPSHFARRTFSYAYDQIQRHFCSSLHTPAVRDRLAHYASWPKVISSQEWFRKLGVRSPVTESARLLSFQGVCANL